MTCRLMQLIGATPSDNHLNNLRAGSNTSINFDQRSTSMKFHVHWQHCMHVTFL